MGKERKWFGTDGARGEYSSEPMTTSWMDRCGQAVAIYFLKNSSSKEIVVGRDTRQSGPILEAAFITGLKKGGASPISIGVLPTAAVAAVTRTHKAAAGAMISASHNPYMDNGIKLFNSEGCKLTDEIENEIESLISSINPSLDAPSTQNFSFEADAMACAIYFKVLQSSLNGVSLDGLNLIVDTSHGAAWQTTPMFLRNLGAQVDLIAASPNGCNINDQCGSQHTERLRKRVGLKSNHIGIAHDGDADRLIMVDENGEELDGDEIMAIIATDWLKNKRLAKQTLVTTQMSNLGLDECVKKSGGHVIRTNVGDRYVFEAMHKDGYNFGGEQSGHMLFLDYFTTGDGLLSALQVLQICKQTQQPLKQLRRVMTRYPQKLTNLAVREKIPVHQLPQVMDAVKEVESSLGSKGRVLLRYSGTENKIRLLIEAHDAKLLPELSERILQPIRSTIGA
jgi:phosphoglucosamine mutase